MLFLQKDEAFIKTVEKNNEMKEFFKILNEFEKNENLKSVNLLEELFLLSKKMISIRKKNFVQISNYDFDFNFKLALFNFKNKVFQI